jgi:hypothetical protein
MNEPHETMPRVLSNRVRLYAAFGGGGAQRLAAQSPPKFGAN